MALGLVLMASTTSAQTGFGGSFDAPVVPPTSQPAPQTTPPTGDGGFGGSFDGDPPAQTDDGGGFSGGSFEPEFVPPRPGETPPEQQAGPEPETQHPPVDDAIAQFEGRDYSVPPTSQLRAGQMHAPTPTTIPGASVVSTAGLAQAINDGIDLVVIDVLGSDYSLPDAFIAPALSGAGHFNDRLQQQAQTWLTQITQNDTDFPIVLYCADPYCWMSYNAALRAVAAGFTNVYWYRGGLQAWQMAGLRLVPAGF